MLNTIGSDMEVFGQDKTGDFIALCGKIGGTKEKPLQIKTLGKGYMLQEDNVALEFNIPVCTNRAQFISAFQTMREHTADLLAKIGLSLCPDASATFAKEQLSHPNALVFGCEPDYDAWSMKENRKPESTNKQLRTCGGHIHVGSAIDMVKGIRNMDLFLGVPSVLVDDKPSSVARRELYGKAGAMRPKPYGFEYRVLSNFWFFEDHLVGWVYKNTKNACNFTHELSEKEGKRIQACINDGNKKEAQRIVDEYKIPLPKEADGSYEGVKPLTGAQALKQMQEDFELMEALAEPIDEQP